MTAREIIEKLKEKSITPKIMDNIEYWPDDFDEDEDEPNGFEYSEETKKLQEISNKLYETYNKSTGDEKNIAYKDWVDSYKLVDSSKMKDKGDYIGVGEFKLVHDIGGGEGGGETVERVWHFVEHDVYLKATGSYYSYHGIDMDDDFTSVTPKEKTIIVYE